MKNKTIFVQIASYRDPELLPTLKDMLHNAKYPKRLKSSRFIVTIFTHNK